MPASRKVIVLGSTGSIGTQALDIIRANGFTVAGLSAGGRQVALLAQQVNEFNVPVVAIADTNGEAELRSLVGPRVEILAGTQAAAGLASRVCDVVLNGITGAAGLLPTVAALKAGTTLALANKESLVIGGRAVTNLAKPGQIVPVDSEHSALAQCLLAGTKAEVSRLILTASGGPFRGKKSSELENVTVEQALNHPTWSMGPVVTINSSTLMNKGLELIEAHLLFDIPMDRIDVVVHPQSQIHSMVEFVDGSTMAQVSPPDMHLPISLGLTWPERLAGSSKANDWTSATSWTFEPVDSETFTAIELAKRVGNAGGTAPAVMNSANEVAVAGFLAGNVKYLDIVKFVEEIVNQHFNDGFVSDELLTVDAVINAHEWAQTACTALIGK
jgi:1-deoxy-D-xylulose-5-phosphate reductoisomerase